MSEEKHKILNMLSEGKITVEECERLLSALDSSEPKKINLNTDTSTLPKFLLVDVQTKEGRGDKVKVKVPFGLLRSGMKLASLIPGDVQSKVDEAMKERGLEINLSDLNSKNLDELLMHFKDLNIDVDSEDEKVKIYCE